MIIYEITTKVQRELAEKFEQFMSERHIPDMLETGYFESAKLDSPPNGNYRIRYLAKDRETLEGYLANYAESLRTDFVKKFPKGIEVSRKILDVSDELKESQE